MHDEYIPSLSFPSRWLFQAVHFHAYTVVLSPSFEIKDSVTAGLNLEVYVH